MNSPRPLSFEDEKTAHADVDLDSVLDEEVDTSGVDETALVRKIDTHVLPLICILYFVTFLDRANISNAAIFGIQADLKLTGLQFNNCLVILSVPYILFEIPANYAIKRFRPSTWLPLCMVLFGLVTVIQGFVKSYGGLLATRFFLGLFEAGMFPGCFYLLAMWYRRSESQKRFSFFFASTTLAGAFAGLIATGIGHMDGMRGYRAWRWVFILEGALTVAVGIVWFFLMPDFPESAKFLTNAERTFVRKRLADDVGGSAHDTPYTWANIRSVFTDYKVFLGTLMYFGCIVPAYGYAYFAPTIIRGLGFSPISAQLHSVPPWIAAFGLGMACAYASDRTRHRAAFGIVPAALGLSGFAVLLAHPASVRVRYGALFLCATGVYTAMPLFIGWYSCNLSGHLRRGVGIAFQIGFGNIGGIFASYAFPATDGPRYTMGYALCIAFLIVAMGAAAAYYVACAAQNKARERRQAAGERDDHLSPEERAVRGDMRVGYRYML